MYLVSDSAIRNKGDRSWHHELVISCSVVGEDEVLEKMTGSVYGGVCRQVVNDSGHSDRRRKGIFFVIQFYLQSVSAHSANCVKRRIQWHVEECSVALLCN
jgi:hypothetical protein